MSLSAILYDALDSLPAARLAGVVATDGLSVEMAYADEDDDPYDLELAELELSLLAANANAASQRIGTGSLQELTLATEELTYLATLVTPGYFAVLALPPDGDVGEARATLRELVGRVLDEL
ncbi:MAG TPA: hypothetical protein PKD53_20760 [Chloroflexaceae bacterium]|nr:hypothetical protein [Chloroflexaceae bacterium]